ncbi:DUF2357 domain-containing protein [Haloimpatiens sp. FM7330]|uniref:DUF2357 domain-containing protein n=1 Tax=Haloimpatiens sp. FM7330 TaxID=3298610 RepID=UPI00363CCFC3
MDTQYKELNDIEVSFYQGIEKKCRFFLSELECYNNPDKYIKIKENKETYIKFKCDDNNAKLYMDGLETVDEDIVIQDEEGEVYIRPSKEKILIYNKDRFPLIPGFSRVILKISDKSYYSMIEIEAKYLEKHELDTIKSDLEKEINGLAFELIKKNLSIGEIKMENIPIEFCKFLMIKSKFSNIMSAIEDLKIKPNYKIKKIYKIVKEDEVKFIDEVTIKSYLEGNIKEGFLKEPITVLDYNLPENQWIKKIIKEISQYLDEFIEKSKNFRIQKDKFINELNKYRGNENEIKNELENIKFLESLIETAAKMKNSINVLNTVQWFKNISYKTKIYSPHTLFYDARYNCIYKLYRELKNNDFSITLDNKYAFQWKRTDKLYEMWCFIKISKIIMGDKLLFKATGGWIFDKKIVSNKILIPNLESGTKITFKKRNIKLNLVYDEKIPYNSINTSSTKMPIYITRSNNRPDGRIDLYIEEIYIGSVILESKYRDRLVLWNKNYIIYQNKKESNVIKQLTAYGCNCQSIHLFKKRLETEGNTDIRPIKKVLIFYPKSTKKIEDVDEIKDINLKFIKFTPDSINGEIEYQIVEAIQELIDRAKRYGIN